MGRTDHQVKIRGFRVELGEIEAVLLRIPQIKAAAILARGDSPGSKQLVAYVVADQSALVLGHIQEQLKRQLPDYMVPAAFVILEEMPLTSNGKVDRKALLGLGAVTSVKDQSIIEPRSAVEKTLVDIWTDVLVTDKPFGTHQDFFDLGGHSLSVIQVKVRIQDSFNLELPIANIYKATTIVELADMVTKQLAVDQDEALLESLLNELEQLPDDEMQEELIEKH